LTPETCHDGNYTRYYYGINDSIDIAFFIWGIIILISGKCKISKYPVKGKTAKAIRISGFIESK